MFFYSMSTISQFTPTILTDIKGCLKSDVRYVNYLCILSYNSRMVDLLYKLFRIKFWFEWYIIWPYLTKFEFDYRTLGPIVGYASIWEKGLEKVFPGYFSNPTCLISVHAKFQLTVTICRFTPKITTLATPLIKIL